VFNGQQVAGRIGVHPDLADSRIIDAGVVNGTDVGIFRVAAHGFDGGAGSDFKEYIFLIVIFHEDVIDGGHVGNSDLIRSRRIIGDLEKAKTLLPMVKNNNNHATAYAAEALLSRVYFYHKEYDKAAVEATNVIESGQFALIDSVKNNYLDMTVSDETIFALISTTLDPSCGTLNGYYRKASTPSLIPSISFLKLFTGTPNDQRLKTLYKEINGKYYLTKFDHRYFDVPLIRLAELYLTRAECRVEAGDITGAQADVNMIRARAGVPDLTYTDPSTLKKFIYYERAKELAFEGDNFFNQKRLGRYISALNLPWNSERLLYKVPQREIDVNPNLVQN